MNDIPGSAENFFLEGARLMGCGDQAGAEDFFKQSLQLVPNLAEAHINLGILFSDAQRWQEAEAHFRRALDIRPTLMEGYLNYAAMLLAQKRFVEAEAAYRQALLIEPESPGVLSSLGVLMACTKREDEAESFYRQAMAIAPEYRKAPFNLAYLLLRQGRCEEGWACLESREWYLQIEKHLNCPRWQGESLAGKKLLISIEAGHGDMIQFCRYAPMVKHCGAVCVSVLCHPGLKSLFTGLCGVDEVIALNEPLPTIGWDYWTPPLSLPFIFNTRLDTIPADLPYIAVEPERVTRFSQVLISAERDFKVGLVWKGNPRFENDADRSLASLADFEALGELSGIRYFSLQKGACQDEAKFAPPFPIVDLSTHIADFSDTAAILMNLDLVISVDTAVAHLAGALGRNCWILLPDYKTDWRWLTDRSDSPWYPKVMRLFRQKNTGDWTTTVAEVKAALFSFIAMQKQFPI